MESGDVILLGPREDEICYSTPPLVVPATVGHPDG